MNINGVTGSVLDLNGNTGFELDNATVLNLNDVKITGNNSVITVNNTNADINLNNSYLDGDVNSSVYYNLGISGNTTFPMLMAGIASKTGYNFEFKDGSFIVQPSLLLSYTFINTFDYKNAAGVSISSEPLNTIQIEPTLKLIKHTKKGWEPYLTAGMRWNLLGKSEVRANDINLPELAVNPYVEYGVGIQKRVQEKYTDLHK